MEKTYKVTYKTYFNERLKKVFFHGVLTYPLYVQLTFDRKTIVFKSYYFELFSKPRYAIFQNDKIYGPAIKDIIKKENELIDFVIDKNLSNFSLELFKQEYNIYSKDLCDEMEDDFIDYLFIFFNDKGMPALATSIQQGSKFRIVFDVVQDMKKSLLKILFDELIENSFFYAPPYLPLFGFMHQSKKWPILSLTVMEWQDEKIKESFIEYVLNNFKNQDAGNVIKRIEKSIALFKNQTSV